MMDFSVGDRVELVRMGPDPRPIEPGATGTVSFVNTTVDMSQISVDWDNGRRLMVCPPEDEIKKI